MGKDRTYAFPFGHGLSYTDFSYSSLCIRTTENGQACYVYADIKNTGSMVGKETVQVYLGKEPCSEDSPVKELKGFRKIELKPGEMHTVVIELSLRAFSRWNEKKRKFSREAGDYRIFVGSSLQDIRLTGSIRID